MTYEETLELLILQYPGKTHLKVEEVARVLNQHPDTVRERMRSGDLPKAEKNNGIWEVSIPDMARIRTPPSKAPQIPSPPVIVGGARRRRAVVMNYRTDRFWAQVARVLGDIETADALDLRAQDLYDEQVRLYLLDRAEKRRAQLAAIATSARADDPSAGRLKDL